MSSPSWVSRASSHSRSQSRSFVNRRDKTRRGRTVLARHTRQGGGIVISVQTVVRFLLAGGGNTLLTAGVTSALSVMVPTAAAYSIGYAAGLALSVVTASRFVFRRRLTTERAGQICAVNLL